MLESHRNTLPGWSWGPDRCSECDGIIGAVHEDRCACDEFCRFCLEHLSMCKCDEGASEDRPGSRPADQAPAGLDASRFDPLAQEKYEARLEAIRNIGINAKEARLVARFAAQAKSLLARIDDLKKQLAAARATVPEGETP